MTDYAKGRADALKEVVILAKEGRMLWRVAQKQGDEMWLNGLRYGLNDLISRIEALAQQPPKRDCTNCKYDTPDCCANADDGDLKPQPERSCGTCKHEPDKFWIRFCDNCIFNQDEGEDNWQPKRGA